MVNEQQEAIAVNSPFRHSLLSLFDQGRPKVGLFIREHLLWNHFSKDVGGLSPCLSLLLSPLL
jgi:hypothetical protein